MFQIQPLMSNGRNFLLGILAWLLPLGASDRPAVGNFQIERDGVFAGWAMDPDSSEPIRVQVFVDGALVDAPLAGQPLPEKGAHGFRLTLAPFGPGSHEVRMNAVGVDSKGRTNGHNPPLAGSPQTFETGLKGLNGSAFVWARDLKPYWLPEARQRDTKVLFNDYVKIGINHSYGGTIMQLYGQDRSVNLIVEHGGAAVQLSVWGYDQNGGDGAWFGTDLRKNDVTAYPTKEACLLSNRTARFYGFAHGAHVCDGVTSKPVLTWGAGAPWNPIQAQAQDGGWHSPLNDVQYAGLSEEGAWEIRHENPFHFTKSTRMEGMTFSQQVVLGDIYAKITYRITYTGPYTTTDHPQEIPAIFAGTNGGGLNEDFTYYSGDRPYADPTSSVTCLSNVKKIKYLRFPGREAYAHKERKDGILAEDWWSTVDREGKHGLTVACFDPIANEAAVGPAPGGGGGAYLSLMGLFGFSPGMRKEVTVYLFPYRWDAVVLGKSIRQRIFELHAAQRGKGSK